MNEGISCRSHDVREPQVGQETGEVPPPVTLDQTEGAGVPDVLPMEETMKVPVAGTRRGKRSKTVKGRATKKPRKRAAKSVGKAPREPQVVFAFRLTKAERDRIHEAAGPGKATRFVRAAALAAAEGDSKGFQALAAQAKANLK